MELLLFAGYPLEAIFLICFSSLTFDGLDNCFLTLAAPLCLFFSFLPFPPLFFSISFLLLIPLFVLFAGWTVAHTTVGDQPLMLIPCSHRQELFIASPMPAWYSSFLSFHLSPLPLSFLTYFALPCWTWVMCCSSLMDSSAIVTVKTMPISCACAMCTHSVLWCWWWLVGAADGAERVVPKRKIKEIHLQTKENKRMQSNLILVMLAFPPFPRPHVKSAY